MAKTSYKNFDLEFFKSGNTYSVKARSLAGEGKNEFTLPFAIAQAESFVLQIERAVVGEALESDLVKKFGSDLFEAVFQAGIQAIYKSSLDLANIEGKGLRIKLHFQDTPEFSHLPWEFLYFSSTNQFLCLNRQTPIIRYVEIPKMISPLRVKLPLRILVMVSRPTDAVHLNVAEEKAKLRQALGDLEKKKLVEILWLEQATVAELQKTLRRGDYHIFHFIGHGDFDTGSNQGWLAFEDENESLCRVNAEQLAAILANHRTLRLVVLNSCKGARNSLTAPFAGAAGTLVQQGIPAVVAMQFTISDAAAVQFAGELYAAIADGLPVDTAVTEARVTLFSSDNRIEWGTPVLFMRASNGSLFDLKKSGAKREPKERTASFKALFYALMTLLLGVITFVILHIIPKGTDIEIEVFAKNVSFSLLAEINAGEEISLLHSGLWTSSIIMENFQPIALTIDSIYALNKSQAFKNPLTISPDSSKNSGIIFSSPSSDISVQEVIGEAGGEISLQRDEESLYFEIRRGGRNCHQTLSFDNYVYVSIEGCAVNDGTGQKLDRLFSTLVRLKLHKVSRSLTIQGEKEEINTSIKRDQAAVNDRAQFILEQRVQNLDFAKAIYRHSGFVKSSTIDSIFVKRSFPFESQPFKPHDSGDLELTPIPNEFMLYNLSEFGNAFKVRAQGRFTSMKIGHGELKLELVPSYFSWIAKHPTTSLVIACLGWIMSVLVPFIIDIMPKKKSREGDE